jgi:hypothetical protein
MAAPGPPDGPPGEESEGIHYFDFSESFEPAETDPFESVDPTEREAPREGRTREAREDRTAREKQPPPMHDAFEFALEDLPSREASTQGGEPEATFAPLTGYFGQSESTGQRARFIDAFDAARMWSERPFLAVALRMPTDAPESAWFPLVEQGIRTALHSDDTLLVDRERRRLVAVLPGRGADAARPLFANLVAYLRDHIGNAAAVSQRISVFTAPNGRPFASGASFLAQVFDKP